MIRLLAVDPSLTGTGVCDDAGNVSSFGTLSTTPLVERWISIRQGVAACYEDSALMIIEEPIIRASGAVALQLAGLAAAIRIHAFQSGLPFVGVSNGTRAKFACGNQKDRTKTAVCMAAARAGSPATNDDEADAWWLWRMGRAAYGSAEAFAALPAYQREAVTAVNWPTINGYAPNTTFTAKKKKKKATI